MTSDRSYRLAMPSLAARQELVRCTGTQFDAIIVEAFLHALGDAEPVGVPAALEPAA